MEYGLGGKVAGVSGAASIKGIGFDIAKALLAEGCKVFISDISAERLEEAKQELSRFGEVLAIPCDVSDEASVQGMFKAAEEHFGGVDIFVSNAGIYPQKALCEMSAGEWDTVMNVNLRSVFLCGREAQKYMSKRGGGVLINAASYAAILGSAGSGAYAASKSAVYSLTKTLAAELAPYHIRVCGFIPGVIATGMTQGVIDERGDALQSQIALRRLGEPQDVGNAVAFLCSDAASYLTGMFLEITGGKFCVQNPDYAWKMLNRD